MKSAEEIASKINEELDKIVFRQLDESGEVVQLKGNVCCVCDQLLTPNEVRFIDVEKLASARHNCLRYEREDFINRDVHRAIYDYYSYRGPMNQPWMFEEYLISPRSCTRRIIKRRRDNSTISKDEFIICGSCKDAVVKNKIPVKGIGNFTIGGLPEQFSDVTDVEFAFVSPVRTHAHFLLYQGGKTKKIKGFHSLMKVDIQKVQNCLTLLEALHTNDHIKVVLAGHFTPRQREKVRKRCEMNIERVKSLLLWLRKHNTVYQELQESEIDQLQIPVVEIIDANSVDEESENENVELTEDFRVVFPDGIVNERNGGLTSAKEFIDIIHRVRKAGNNVELVSRTLNESVPDYKDNNLVKAFPKCFPYGIGGPQEKRLTATGELRSLDIEYYLEHMCMMSNTTFHEQMICLVMFNMYTKQSLVRNAFFRSRDNMNLTGQLANLKAEELLQVAEDRSHGMSPDLRKASYMLRIVDSVTQCLPHSDRAAEKARGDIDALTVTNGNMSYFLTITPNEENGIELQAYSGEDIDISDETAVRSLPAEELRKRALLREKLSFKLPGLASFYFMQVLDIVNLVVVGWNFNTNCAVEGGGLFGVPKAVSNTIEEQGRYRLHAHIGITIDRMQETLEQLFTGHNPGSRDCRSKEKYKEKAKAYIAEATDHCCSTAVAGHIPDCELTIASKHKCDERGSKKVIMVDKQCYRNMRHKHGAQKHEGILAMCESCGLPWNSNEITLRCAEANLEAQGVLCNLLSMEQQVEFKTSTYTNDVVNTLLCHNRASQLLGREGTISVQVLVNFARNVHSSSHNESCFKYDAECRYCFPWLPREETTVEMTGQEINWYSWNGAVEKRPIFAIIPKRHRFDAFVNTYCKAISSSNLCCNSNCQIMMPGPANMYVTKYLTKGNEKDETMSYSKTAEFMQKRLSETRKDTDFGEGLSRIISASLIHNSKNVIGPALARYLTLHKSRFRFSQSFCFVPVSDILRTLERTGVSVLIQNHVKRSYLENSAYHYIFRPYELESLCPIRFCEEYEVRSYSERLADEQTVYRFTNDHPNGDIKCIVKRKGPVVAKMRIFDFARSSDFKGNILDSNYVPNENCEHYARCVLMHFMPYRTLDDLKINGSFLQKLRDQMNPRNVCRRKLNLKTERTLQLIQDRRNNDRVPPRFDELKNITVRYESGTDSNEEPQEEIIIEEYDEVTEMLLHHLSSNESNDQSIHSNEQRGTIIQKLSLSELKSKGGFQKDLCEVDIVESPEAFLEIENSSNRDTYTTTNNTNSRTEWPKHSQTKLVELMCRIRSRIARSGNMETSNSIVDSINIADGSCKSIMKWSRRKQKIMIADEEGKTIEIEVQMDRDQQRAFQLIVAKFVLTYYDEVNDDPETNDTTRTSYLRNKVNLITMTNGIKHLLMFFSGPGGSGKSEVVKQVLQYCKEFCDRLHVEFDSSTIRITALTGIAATLINGETIHSAAGLEKRRSSSFKSEMFEDWQRTRLLIIDEISFMSVDKLITLNSNLQRLRERWSEKFGGLDIIFSGDFSQLEPVGKDAKALYQASGEGEELWHRAINCYIELKGLHRFTKDRRWGMILFRLRQGMPTKQDLQLINSRVIRHSGKATKRIPRNIRYGVYHNNKRDSIHASLFEKQINNNTQRNGEANKDIVIILSDELQIRDEQDTFRSCSNLAEFYENVGESNCECGRNDGRFDPVLKLYKNCEVLLTINDNVKKGRANGTQLLVVRVVLKEGQTRGITVVGDRKVQVVTASQVAYLECKTKGSNPKVHKIKPTTKRFKAHYPLTLHLRAMTGTTSRKRILHMSGTQIPVVSNNATTGFKLQGSSVDALLVKEWHNTKNWEYVMLSRVRELEGLFLDSPISENPDDYMLHPRYLSMLADFQNVTCPTLTTDNLDLDQADKDDIDNEGLSRLAESMTEQTPEMNTKIPSENTPTTPVMGRKRQFCYYEGYCNNSVDICGGIRRGFCRNVNDGSVKVPSDESEFQQVKEAHQRKRRSTETCNKRQKNR